MNLYGLFLWDNVSFYPMQKDLFSSKIFYLFATLSMAIGTGNIWRFPRLFAMYGGITFLIPWFIFLFLWSIPLLIAENSLGIYSRKSLVGTFEKFGGEGWLKGGTFVALVTFMIASYYSVVTGWCMGYLLTSIKKLLFPSSQYQWNKYFISTLSQGHYTFILHFLSSLISASIVALGIRKGIEKISAFAIPLLFISLIYLLLWALLEVDPSMKGISYVLNFNTEKFLSAETWIQALSQSAWSTGAGWGLLITYAASSPEKTDVVGNSFLTGIGNNLASILAGLCIVSVVFGTYDLSTASTVMKSGNTGLTFEYLPSLFEKIPFGNLSMLVFFFTLFIAALSSLISMFEMVTKIMIDQKGYSRKKSALISFVSICFAGTFSAYNTNFLDNQDWVWGIGLILSGFIVFLLGTGRKNKFKEISENFTAYKKINSFFSSILFYAIPLLFVLLISWWLFFSFKGDLKEWLNPFGKFSTGTCLLQWLIGFVFVYLFSSGFLRKR